MDARAVARLLATCETLGHAQGMSPIDLKDAKELLGWWTRALQGSTLQVSAPDGAGVATAGDVAGCLFVGDVSLCHPITHQTIFTNLHINDLSTPESRAAALFQKAMRKMLGKTQANRTREQLHKSVSEVFGPFCLPPNQIIGLRSTTSHAKLSELSLLQMLNGGYSPQEGVAMCTRTCELVSQSPVVLSGTLLDNLTYSCKHGSGRVSQMIKGGLSQTGSEVPVEFDDEGNLKPEADRYVWELCRKIGMSSHLIGDECVAGSKFTFCRALSSHLLPLLFHAGTWAAASGARWRSTPRCRPSPSSTAKTRVSLRYGRQATGLLHNRSKRLPPILPSRAAPTTPHHAHPLLCAVGRWCARCWCGPTRSCSTASLTHGQCMSRSN
jgi:hypothetical protein